MDKGRRHELKMLKFKKRIRQLNLDLSESEYHCYKTTGKPCSCWMCSPYKYNRRKKVKERPILIQTDFIHRQLKNAV